MQRQLEEEAKLQPKTLKCFAGLCETALPVRVGQDLTTTKVLRNERFLAAH